MIGSRRAPISGQVDVLVIGAGPAGATVARRVLDQVAWARVLLVDAGPQLGPQIGVNVRNLEPHARAAAEAQCEAADTAPRRRTMPNGMGVGEIVARPGTHLLHATPFGSPQEGLYAAAYSMNVGGMAAHWTCAIPRPEGSESIPFIRTGKLDRAFGVAEGLLRSTQTAYPETHLAKAVRRELQHWFEPLRGAGRPVQPMPLACSPSNGSRQPKWSGVDTILGDLSDQKGSDARIVVYPDAICRRLRISDQRVKGAEFEDVHSHEPFHAESSYVVLACGAFHTPQLLWASGIRPPALGRYLNVHSQTVASVSLHVPAVGVSSAGLPEGDDRIDLCGVYWLPFNDECHPFSGQVMLSRPADGTFGPPVAGIAWYGPKTLDCSSRITFSESRLDGRGMPWATVHHTQSDRDRASCTRALELVAEVAPLLGPHLPGSQPTLLVDGKSLHYQGTARMGADDDGRSVCDIEGRVWGFDNVYVAGNSVIPTSTACNPTLTAVALATITADSIVASITSQR